ncbi:GNAT superfamily N-acetyltransferase [Kibdelosporangium banguiense]|uniref:GNAT superfamily N-acetyltransferase n=1 Tax=Kibdelosporangium banguiense TaxID=1365924 RepID=A0ABS4U0V2_9PSEU|nr:GNAT family N-acetyltransferase [Kibdelosporangium banguiense]MBP2330283.1 GNAT superfamily N-acetyltransferase [Kibdelosporangium banguiense]
MPDAATLLAAYDDRLRPAEATNLEAGAWAESDGPIVRIVGKRRGFISAPRDLGVDGAELDALIARQRDFFAARRESVEWKTRSHDLPAGIPGRLLAAGFQPEDEETVVISLTETQAAPPVLPDGVQIRQTDADADMHRIAAMESAVWGEDLSWLGENLISRKAHLAVFVAEADGQVVSAAWLVFKYGKDFGGLWGGSTLAEWRGRGIYRALVRRRAQLAAEMGLRYLQVDASEDSRPILERLGFTAVTKTRPYVWTP